MILQSEDGGRLIQKLMSFIAGRRTTMVIITLSDTMTLLEMRVRSIQLSQLQIKRLVLRSKDLLVMWGIRHR